MEKENFKFHHWWRLVKLKGNHYMSYSYLISPHPPGPHRSVIAHLLSLPALPAQLTWKDALNPLQEFKASNVDEKCCEPFTIFSDSLDIKWPLKSLFILSLVALSFTLVFGEKGEGQGN